MDKKNCWFPMNQKDDSEKLYRVFCFHYAGGSSTAYKNWNKNSHPIEFIPVELPGRGTRIYEPCIEEFDVLMDELIPNLKKMIDHRPFFFYGHSMGAIIAFRAAYKLQKLYGIHPEKLIVAGRHAPHRGDSCVFKSYMGEEALIKELKRLEGTPKEALENKELLQFILPLVKSDYKLHESYKYYGEKLSIPIIAHAGINDGEANIDEMQHWNKVTGGSFEIKEFQGNHFFVQTLGNKYVSEIIKIVMSTESRKI
ncbi:thioesterase II family protein [Clostridium estertheticum]|uniref:thioesterase II family protein n=1 Tax=Clostridium estertheticum TaxID=238834 RepID=UPI001C0B8F43|nr:thioesterase domain-containing protein [Clostridium estertheticum]MBU3186317.1 thioesterase [Clostridium estertheticum]